MAEKWVSKWAAQVFLSLFGTVDYFWNVFRKFWYAPIEKYSNMPKFRQEIKQIFALTALKTHFSLLYFQSPTSKFRIPDPSLMMIMQLEISWFGWKFNYNLPASKDFLFRYVFKIQWDESAHKCLVRSITIGNWLGLDWIDVVSTEIVGERLNCEVEVYVHFIWGGAVWRTLLDRRRNEGS